MVEDIPEHMNQDQNVTKHPKDKVKTPTVMVNEWRINETRALFMPTD